MKTWTSLYAAAATLDVSAFELRRAVDAGLIESRERRASPIIGSACWDVIETEVEVGSVRDYFELRDALDAETLLRESAA